jgi:hypothetical protein
VLLAVVTVPVDGSAVLSDVGGRVVCNIRKSVLISEERVSGLVAELAGVVFGVTVPLNVVMNLDGVEFTVTAPLYSEVRSNIDNKVIVLMNHNTFSMVGIFSIFLLLDLFVEGTN